MKKQHHSIKMLICLLIFICLISCGNSNIMYQLTLDGNGATIHSMERVYFNASNGKWYSDTGIATPISRVVVPKRQFTLKYDYNTDMAVTTTVPYVYSSYVFSSYPGYTDSQGNILSSASLESNAITHANWISGDKGYVTVSLPESVPSATGLSFLGWKKNLSGSKVYQAGDVITFEESEIVDNTAYVIATWETSNEVRLVLKNSQDATDYSVYRYRQSNNKWYTKQNVEVDTVPIPEKKFRVDFNPNSPNIEGGKVDYSNFPFLGYYNNENQYISSQGVFDILSTLDLQKDEITVVAKWGEQKPITLPELSKNGEKFLGWNKSGKQEELVMEAGSSYSPTADNEVLYGVWESLPVYKLELASSTSTTPAIEAIYYRTNDRWYKDEKAQSAIEKIEPPKKVWKIEYNPNLGENDTSIPITKEEYPIGFKGFTLENGDVIISSDGKINTNYQIDRNSTAEAKWDTPPLRPVPKNISREGYTLLGWDEDKTKADPEYKDNIKYKDINVTILYAIWADNRLWTLNVNVAPDRPSKKYYYKPSSNEWYITPYIDGQLPVVGIDAEDMTREYKVYFESNMDNTEDPGEVKYRYSFVGADNFIGPDGSFVSSPDQDNLVVSLNWEEGEGLDVSPESKPIASSGYKHLGWSTEPDGNEITEKYIPNKDVILYAKWQDSSVYRLVLDSNDASSMGSSEVFYKSSTGKWYLTGTPDEGDEGIDSIELPEKIWTAEFDANYGNPDKNPLPLTSVWKFKGYSPYIDENGAFVKGINSDMTVKAMWADQSSIIMPVIEREHYTLKGWSKTGDIPGISGEYLIGADELETGEYSVLYKAIWEPNVYKLTLDDDNATTPSSGSIYYIYNKGWYNDEKGQSAFIGITPPKKEWKVTFRPYLGSSDITEMISDWSFGGYTTTGDFPVSYILNDGTLRNGATLTSSVTVKAIWDNQREVSFPAINEREGFVFDKWQKDNEIITSPYYPQSNGEVIEGIWIDAYALNNAVYTFEDAGYTLDSFDKDAISELKNYALPSAYDDGVNGMHKVVKIKGDYGVDSPFKGSLKLTYINIPSTIDSIPVNGFKDCTNLKNVVLPSTCSNIGDSAFSGCISLERIIFKGTKEQWKAVTRGADWHSGVVKTDIVECTDGTVGIDESLFAILNPDL